MLVAERISHFCLARNLIRPLELTHNFTQSGWLILFSPDYLSGQHKLGNLPNTFFSENSLVQDRRLTVCSSIAAAASHYHEGSSLIYGHLASISLRPRVPSWIWIRWIQYATHRKNFTSRPKLAMSTAMQNFASTLSYFFIGNIFWRHSRFSPKQPEPQTHSDFNVSLLKQQTRLLLHYGEHISLAHPTMP